MNSELLERQGNEALKKLNKQLCDSWERERNEKIDLQFEVVRLKRQLQIRQSFMLIVLVYLSIGFVMGLFFRAIINLF